jgi:flagellar basal-body rod modification protein FlgD
MVDPVSTSTSSSAAQSSAFGLVTANQKALGESDFLKLLVEQLKHQDPLQPQDNTAFVAQLAQFSGLEQSMQMNSSLGLIMTQLRGQANAQLTSMVGQTVTIQGSKATLDGDGTGGAVMFSLSAPAASAKITIADASGNTLRVLDLGSQKAGLVQARWDGRDSTGTLQPAGTYSVSVSATGSSGATVPVNQNVSGIVTSLSFDQGYPVLNLNNGVAAPVSDLLRVGSAPSNT